MTTETKTQIPWDKFSEEEIQHLISMLFFNLNYHIEHLHKSDRANESGADIIVKKGKENIAIAVKIKPDNKDRTQLIDLVARRESKKIYIYIKTPTSKFINFIKKYNKKVEFWDAKKLNDFFFQKNPYFSSYIIFDNHQINDSLIEIKELLFWLLELSKDAAKKEFSPMDKESHFLLWRLKDASVVLNQTNFLIERLFEEPFNFKNKIFEEHFIRIFLNYLDTLQIKIISFKKYFLKFLEKNPQLVLNSISEHSSSSHWFFISGYNPINDISVLKNELNEAIENKKLLNILHKNIKKKRYRDIEEYEKDIAKGNDIWKAIQNKLKSLHYLGEGIEYVIDDILTQNFNDPDRLDIAKDFDDFF